MAKASAKPPASDAKKTKPQTRQGGLSLALVALAFAAAAVAVAAPEIPSFTGDRHANKPFSSFTAFYPFYQREHSQSLTRALHFAGTAVVLFLVALTPALAAAAVFAGSVGFILCGALAGLPTGAVEGGVLLVLYLLAARSAGAGKAALATLLVGYGGAWAGHYFVEHNRPATFIYPTYSLMGDFQMFYAIATGAEPL